MGLWDKLKAILEKIPDVAKNISKLSDNKDLKSQLDKAGNIGGLINFSLVVIQQVRPYFTSKERIAFSQLLELLLFSAQQALPDNIKNLKVRNVVDNEFTSGLFTYFLEDKWYPYMYASNNKIVSRFKEQLKSILVENDLSGQDIRKTLDGIDDLFTNYLKEKRPQFKELDDLLTRKESQTTVDEKIKFLEYMMTECKFYKSNESDKFLYEYYVENEAYLEDAPLYWKNEEDGIPKQEKWDVNKFLYDPVNGEDFIVIAAPFGIGKSSYARHLVSKLAADYLDISSNNDLTKSNKYIPIFVPLKYDFFDVYNNKHLDDVLNLLTDNKTKIDVKILCVFDGLDEYKKGVTEFYSRRSNYHQSFKGMKSIITTRLEAKFPEELHIYKNPLTDRYRKYVRLFSFDKIRIRTFFVNYGIGLEYYEEMMKVMSDYTILAKPLFCWMIAYTMKNNTSVINLIKSAATQHVVNSKTILYFYFIHSIVMGRKYDKHVNDEEKRRILYEKRALRKLAALTLTEEAAKEISSEQEISKQSTNYQNTKQAGLSSELVSKYLEDIDNVVDTLENKHNGIVAKTINLSAILSTYFFSIAESTEKRIEFLHSSLKEYLIAEYYIESILDGTVHRLNIGNPSKETISFLDDLLNIIYLSSKNVDQNNEFIELFLNSFIFKGNKNLLYQRISENCSRFVERPFLIINKALQRIITSALSYKIEENAIAHTLGLKFEEKFEETWDKLVVTDKDIIFSWIGKWILLYCISTLKSLANPKVDGSDIIPNLALFIMLSSNAISPSLKRLKYSNLVNADLSNANLASADLSHADLSNANLASAHIIYADLSNAILTSAALMYTSLSSANLSNANLSHANLSNANLSHANLSNANLTTDILSYASLTSANLSHANLSNANLIYANLIYANLSNANLTSANLSNANLSHACLAYVEINEKTNFTNAILPDTFPLTKVKYSSEIDKLNEIKNNESSSASASVEPIRRIVKYTSDGTPAK